MRFRGLSESIVRENHISLLPHFNLIIIAVFFSLPRPSPNNLQPYPSSQRSSSSLLLFSGAPSTHYQRHLDLSFDNTPLVVSLSHSSKTFLRYTHHSVFSFLNLSPPPHLLRLWCVHDPPVRLLRCGSQRFLPETFDFVEFRSVILSGALIFAIIFSQIIEYGLLGLSSSSPGFHDFKLFCFYVSAFFSEYFRFEST